MSTMSQIDHDILKMRHLPNYWQIIMTLWPNTSPKIHYFSLEVKVIFVYFYKVFSPHFVDEGLFDEAKVHEGNDPVLSGA